MARRVALVYRRDDKAAPYADALRSAGVEPEAVTPVRVVGSLDGFAGLVLSGGTDIDPRLYGVAPEPHTHAPDRERDALELRLLAEALARDVPVLAICRGMQLFNVAHPGGTLAQHVEGHTFHPEDASEPAHDILVEPGSLLASIMGAGAHAVNSRHHQAVAQVGGGLTVAARARGDKVVEALERPDRRFALAVQWHPEDQIRRSGEQRKLFEAFAAAL